MMLRVTIALIGRVRLVAAQQARAGPNCGGLAKIGPVLIDIFLVEENPFFLLRLGRQVFVQVGRRRQGRWHRRRVLCGMGD